MILTKTQVKQLTSIFRKNEVMLERIEIIEESKTGIGVNMYAIYVTNGEHHSFDITEYENW